MLLVGAREDAPREMDDMNSLTRSRSLELGPDHIHEFDHLMIVRDAEKTGQAVKECIYVCNEPRCFATLAVTHHTNLQTGQVTQARRVSPSNREMANLPI
jgi:hypothetical protein